MLKDVFIFFVSPSFLLWPFDPNPGHGLLLRGFAITLIGRTTIGRTPLDEGSAGYRDLYLTTHCTHNIQTSMPPGRLEHTIPVSEQPQIQDRAATGIGY